MPTEPDLIAWHDYLLARKKSLDAAWNATKTSYKSLKQVRADLHLAFVDDNDAGAWSVGQDQDAVDLQYACHVLLSAADDALVGRRKVGWSDTSKDYLIERLPTDKVQVYVENDHPILISVETGAAFRAAGTISDTLAGGTLVLGTELAALCYFGAFIAAEREAFRLMFIAGQKTLGTLASYQQMALATGATPEQKTLFARAIADGTQGIYAARSEVPPVVASSTTTSTGISSGEKILLASVIVSALGLAVKMWSEVKKSD